MTGQGGPGNTYQVPTSVSEQANVIVGQQFTFEDQQLFVSSGRGDVTVPIARCTNASTGDQVPPPASATHPVLAAVPSA